MRKLMRMCRILLFCFFFDEVKEKGFTLVPSRYIEFVNRDENIDFDTKMKSLQENSKNFLFKRKIQSRFTKGNGGTGLWN